LAGEIESESRMKIEIKIETGEQIRKERIGARFMATKSCGALMKDSALTRPVCEDYSGSHIPR